MNAMVKMALCLSGISIAVAPQALAWTINADVTFPQNTARGWAFGSALPTETKVTWINIVSTIKENGSVRDQDHRTCYRQYSGSAPLAISCVQYSVDTTLTNGANYCAPASGVVSANNTPKTYNKCVVWHADGGGGGGCHVANPATTMVTLDGVVAELGTGLANELTLLGTADDGTQFVLDQYAIVRAGGSRQDTRMKTYGFDSVSLSEPGTLPTLEAEVLLVHHQGQHPPNHRFAPTPIVTFQPQSYRAESAVTSRGWAVVNFGTRGKAETVRVLPADGGMTSPSLEAKVLRGVRSDFLDERRHRYIGYFAYQVEGGRVEMKGSPIVVLPMCCQADCPPAPGSCY